MTLIAGDSHQRTCPEPILSGQRTLGPQILVYIFMLATLAALLAAVPAAWGWGLLGWVDVALFVAMYYIS